LSLAVARAGDLQAGLRGVHLKAHIEQARILTPAQIARYAALRGYASGHHDAGHDTGRDTGHRPRARH
jgi:hypothetical protein